MRILGTRALAIPDVKVIAYARFADARGYFTETYRLTDLDAVDGLRGVRFVQANESWSRAGVMRGLHFQWSPHQGKLVRPVHGRIIDIVLDIRLGSPTFGSVIAHDMPADPESTGAEWIWVPPGFAHGLYFPGPGLVEYLCTAAWSPGCEAGISPCAKDLDWSLCQPDLASLLRAAAVSPDTILSDKDRAGHTLATWTAEASSAQFPWRPCEAGPARPTGAHASA